MLLLLLPLMILLLIEVVVPVHMLLVVTVPVLILLIDPLLVLCCKQEEWLVDNQWSYMNGWLKNKGFSSILSSCVDHTKIGYFHHY